VKPLQYTVELVIIRWLWWLKHNNQIDVCLCVDTNNFKQTIFVPLMYISNAEGLVYSYSSSYYLYTYTSQPDLWLWASQM